MPYKMLGSILENVQDTDKVVRISYNIELLYPTGDILDSITEKEQDTGM